MNYTLIGQRAMHSLVSFILKKHQGRDLRETYASKIRSQEEKMSYIKKG